MSRSPLFTISCVRIAALVALVTSATSAYAQTFTVFDVPNARDTEPMAINPAGQITGWYADAIFMDHGFLREPDGTMLTFGPSFTVPAAINSEGQIAGSSDNDGFLRQKDGTIITFDVPNSAFTVPAAINSEGQIAGSYGDQPFRVYHGFLRDADGSITTFDPNGSIDTQVAAISPAGQLTGYYVNGEEPPLPSGRATHGFLREPDGTIITFDPPGASYTRALAINPAGQITGFYQDSSLDLHGFVRQSDGTIDSFDVVAGTNPRPSAINPAGQITGWYADANVVYHGFLREPDGTITTFDPPSSSQTIPQGINPAGQITGRCADSHGNHGFVSSPASHTTGEHHQE